MSLLATLFPPVLTSLLILLVSHVLLTLFAFALTHALSLVVRDEQPLHHSNDPDLPRKENTVAIMLGGFLGGLHLVLVFVGLPLLGHAEDSFAMRVFFSGAVLAAGLMGIVVGGVVAWIVWGVVGDLVARVAGRAENEGAEQDVEAAVVGEPLLLEKEEHAEKA